MPTTWFITGTSSGFGRSLTQLLLARGDRVAATLRTPPRLDDLAARDGDRFTSGRGVRFAVLVPVWQVAAAVSGRAAVA